MAKTEASFFHQPRVVVAENGGAPNRRPLRGIGKNTEVPTRPHTSEGGEGRNVLGRGAETSSERERCNANASCNLWASYKVRPAAAGGESASAAGRCAADGSWSTAPAPLAGRALSRGERISIMACFENFWPQRFVVMGCEPFRARGARKERGGARRNDGGAYREAGQGPRERL